MTIELPCKPCALYGEFENAEGERLRVQIIVTKKNQQIDPADLPSVTVAEQLEIPSVTNDTDRK